MVEILFCFIYRLPVYNPIEMERILIHLDRECALNTFQITVLVTMKFHKAVTKIYSITFQLTSCKSKIEIKIDQQSSLAKTSQKMNQLEISGVDIPNVN